MQVDAVRGNAPVQRIDAQTPQSTVGRESPSQLVPGQSEPAAGGQPAEVQDPRRVNQAVERLNKMADIFAKSLRFSVHQKTNTIVVRLVDNQTGEVIREIPPEKILRAVSQMQELMGILFDSWA